MLLLVMKVEFCETIEVEVQSHVTIGPAEIAEALNELSSEVRSAADYPELNDNSKKYWVKKVVNSACQSLEAIDASLIAVLSGESRKLIAQKLREQADRFDQ